MMDLSLNQRRKTIYGKEIRCRFSTIRKKTVTKNGKQYTYWEARYSVGYDPGTGKQIKKTITGKTQKEVSQKLKAAITAIDEGTYIAPSKLTVGEWLDIWTKEYLCQIKPRTAESYIIITNNHLKPGLGGTKLDRLDAHTVQTFYNGLSETKNCLQRQLGTSMEYCTRRSNRP